MYYKETKVRPDTLTSGDYIFDTNTKQWEHVTDAYWDEEIQRCVVKCGPLGICHHIYGELDRIYKRNYYYY